MKKKYLLRTLLLCVLMLTGSGKLWADETIFSTNLKGKGLNVAAGTTDGTIASDIATFSGGSMYVINNETAEKTFIVKKSAYDGSSKKEHWTFQITGSKTFFKVVLNKPLQAGDVINVVLTSNKNTVTDVTKINKGLWFSISNPRPSAAPSTEILVAPKSKNEDWVNADPYTIKASDDICGKTTFYIYRATGTTTNFNSLTITRTVADNRSESSVSFGSTTSASVDMAEQSTYQLPTPTTTPANATLTYESNNTAAATVNDQGLVTLVGMGTAKITAKFAGNDSYKPSSAEFTLTVEDSNFKIFENAGGEGNITNSGIVTVTHKVWDFTNWSAATITNLKADAAASTTKGWSDIEKAADVNDPTKAKDGYFWSVANTTVGGEVTANGVVIEELKGLVFHNAYSTARSLSIINLSNMKCLWLGGSKKSCFTIKNVKVGSQLTMEVESHKTEARGVQLYYNSVADGNKIGAAFTPTTKASNTWTVTGPSGAETVDVIVQNTNGCHIYTIEADIAEAKTTKLQMKENVVVAAGYKTTFGNGAIGLTFGKEGDDDFAKASAHSSVNGYVAYTGGNGGYDTSNGSGTSYTFEPEYPGTLEVGVVLNLDKAFYIEEDGTPLADYNGITVDAKYYGTYKINVMGGKTYKFYAAGSGLGFYGFEYKANVAKDIAEFKKYANGSEVLLTLTDAKVTAKSAGNLYYVIEDVSGAMPVIASDLGLAVGKILNGTILLQRNESQGHGATTTANSNMNQMAMADGTVEPTLVSDMSYFSQEGNDFRYVKLETVTTNPKSSIVPGVTNYVVNKDGQTLYIANGFYSGSINAVKGKNKLESIAGIFRRLDALDPTKAEDIVAGEDQSLNEVTIAEFKQLAEEEEAALTLTDAAVTFVDGTNIYVQEGTDAIVLNDLGIDVLAAGKKVTGSIAGSFGKTGDDAPRMDKTDATNGDDITAEEATFATPRYESAADVQSDDMIHAMVRLGRSKYVDGVLTAPAGTTNTIKVVDKFQKNIEIPEDLAYIVGIIGKEGNEYVLYPVHEDSLKQYTNIVTEYMVGNEQDQDDEQKVAETIPAGAERNLTGIVMTATEDMAITEDAVKVSEGTDKEKAFTHKVEGDSFTFDATRKGTLTVYLEKQPKQELSVTEDGKAMKALTSIRQRRDSLEIPVVGGSQYVLTGTVTPLGLRGFTFRDDNAEALDVASNIALFKNLYRDNIATEDTLWLKDAVVTYIYGDDVFVEDASGAIDFYRTHIQFYAGQKLNGYIVGKTTEESYMPKLRRTSKTSYKTFKAEKGVSEPKVITVAEALEKKNLARFVKLENLMLQRDQRNFRILVDTLTGESIHVEDHFRVFYQLNDTVHSIVGILGMNDEGVNYIWPTSKEGVVSTATYIEPEPEPEPEVEQMVATLTLNGSEVSDPEGFFSHDTSGKFNFNAKFTDASYEGIDFSKGLKMESSTKVMFTAPGDGTTVTIVQSTLSDKTLKFDDTELAVADAVDGTGCRIYTITDVAEGEHSITRGSGESGIFFVKVIYTPVEQREPYSWDFQELCMKLGKGGPWAVNDGGDAEFTVDGATMHFLGDYTEQGEEFAWNNLIAYEYVADRGKFTMRNKNNKKDSNCGMFSWDYSHYVSLTDLRDGDKVTITIPTGTVTFVSDNVEGAAAGDAITSGQTYTIKTSEKSTRLDIQMAKATLIAKISVEPANAELVPTISVNCATLALIPEATMKLIATVSPAVNYQWKSDNEAVATVAEDGTVTAVSAGTANISCTWKSEKSDKTASATCVVTVADVDLSKMAVVKTYDFTTMGDVSLEIQSEAAGAIYNAGNSKNNDVFFCTNEGLEDIAVQAVAGKTGKGWSIADGEGLYLGSGAGRCAAINGIKAGQVVEFIYTGADFYTSATDDGVEKAALNEGVGRAIYRANADGMIGFELVKGNAVQKIIVYDDPTSISSLKAATIAEGTVYNLSGQKVSDSENGLKPGLYIIGGRKVVVK